jgi:pimeloyl-ACP methyl ester carboxylesterase
VSLTTRETQEIDQANASGLQPVVFVHGLWMLALSWQPWRSFFEDNPPGHRQPGQLQAGRHADLRAVPLLFR